MRKRIIALVLAALFACALFGCSAKDKAADERGQTKESEESGGESRDFGKTAYYFVGGSLVGSLENGVFMTATDPARDRTDAGRYRRYTIKELFSDEYIYFDRDSARGEANEAAIYTGEGPGGFDEDMTAVFAPYAVRTIDGGWVSVLPLPCILPDGFAVYAPEYGFFVNVSRDIRAMGDCPALATNFMGARLPDGLSWDNGFTARDEDATESALAANGIKFGAIDINTVSGDFDSDGKTESVIFANAAADAEGFLVLDPDAGEAPFGLILFCDDDERYETVYLCAGEAVSDVTSHFTIVPVGIFDLDADGDFEICASSHEWEWGSTFVLAKNDSGAWDTVMTAEWGT
ncbi:MAG: hypothetical protein IKD89_00330 [Clostridia bacterium]|nr:hypothetical protein [Clostridia bacterium]